MALYPGSLVPLWSSIIELCSMKITELLAKAEFAQGKNHMYVSQIKNYFYNVIQV